MRLDPDSTGSNTPSRPFSNGSNINPLHKTVLNNVNGNSHPQSTANGSSFSEPGSQSMVPTQRSQPEYFGHDREEVTRILIQSLTDLGYNNAAGMLSQESGYELESPSVAAFRNAVLQGHWSDAEELLFGGLSAQGGGVSNSKSRTRTGLSLAEEANTDEMLFRIRQQKFLELVEQRELSKALVVLRTELTPLHHDTEALHALSSLVMYSADDLKARAGWDGAAGKSRQMLLSELSRSISPSVMIPEHRLAVLLQQVKQNQISNCLFHNTADSPSLYTDHFCDPSQFPRKSVLELDKHSDEVWYLEFSHNGRRLASTSRDTTIIIYETETFEVVRKLTEHKGWVAYVSWSPDDSKLLSCSHDKRAKLWDMHSGTCVFTIDQHTEPVSSCSWAPDGLTFVTGSMDKHMYAWDLNGRLLHTWEGYRINDCVISPDGKRLVCVTTDKKIHVYNYLTRLEEYNISLKVDLTCLSISRDSRYMLVNMSDNEIQLRDIETADVVRRFTGQKQGHYVIRSAFGGATENFVISGSEDSKIYIWHKDNGVKVEELSGHSGCVNSVAWNPRDPSMFASAGDDHIVRIWSKESSAIGNPKDTLNGHRR